MQKFVGVNNVHYGLCENGECQSKDVKEWKTGVNEAFFNIFQF